MRGRKPTPPYLRLLRGNPGHRPVKPGIEAERPIAPPEPLGFLSPYAVEEWRRVAPEMTRLGTLANLDLGPFGAYCESYATWRTAEEALARIAANDPATSGLLLKRDREVVANPLIRIARRAADAMLRIAAEFGMTPVARARIASGPLAETGRVGKFDGLLGGH
jgi:P27 family predicted phage terminase small subunit